MLSIKLMAGSHVVNVVKAYTPQIGLNKEVKKLFWEYLNEVVT